MVGILIVLGVLVLCAVFAVVGASIGAKMETKALGAGPTEGDMRTTMTASTLGGLLGMIPFLAFIVVLVVMIMTAPPLHDDAPAGGSAPAAAH